MYNGGKQIGDKNGPKVSWLGHLKKKSLITKKLLEEKQT